MKLTKSEYLRRVTKAHDDGRIDASTYAVMIMNADIFTDEDEEKEYGLPRTYAEIEYDDFENPEVIEGARFDDMNYLRYMER